MKEKGGTFPRSLALAVAVHALLFLLLMRLIAPPVVAGPRVDPVDVQLAGTWAGGPAGSAGAGGGWSSAGAAPAASRHTPVRQPTNPLPVAAQASTKALPAPSQALTPQPAAPPTNAAVQPDTPVMPAPEEAAGERSLPQGTGTGGTGNGAPGAGGPGSGSGTGGGVSGTGDAGFGPGDSWGGMPPETVADIDPTPFRPISAAYPPSARRLGQQGLVKVQADINAQGMVIDAQILRSSGFSALDNAALEAVKSTRFIPAMKNGRPVESRLLVPIRFQLTQE